MATFVYFNLTIRAILSYDNKCTAGTEIVSLRAFVRAILRKISLLRKSHECKS